jgi:MOSC domain-containing protein
VGGGGALVATVVGLWRYPVKSMQGERLGVTTVQADGLAGDRRWGVRDEETGRVLTGRREPRLLDAVATLGDDGGEPTIVLPDGARINGVGAATHAALSDWLARPVRLIAATELGERAEYFADATNDSSVAIEWTMPPGRFVDAMPLLMLTTASLRAGAALYPDGAWDVRRFRPNVLLDVPGDGWVEDAWCGHAVRIGGVVEVAPRELCIRCTMVTRPQSGLVRDLDIYRTLARHHDGNLGVWTAVRTTGSIAEGDTVYIDTAPAPDTFAG